MVKIFCTYSGGEKSTIGGEGFDSVCNVSGAALSCLADDSVIYADIVSGNRERRGGCRPFKVLASSWGVQEMNTLLSGIDDYGIEKKGSSFNGDGHEQCLMEEADVPSSPKEKGDNGDELQWLKTEFAKTNAKAESCMSLLKVVLEDVKFIKSQLLVGTKSNVGKQDAGIPRRDGDDRVNDDFKGTGDAGERHDAFGGFDKTPDFKELGDAGERHYAFGCFDKTPSK
ncbi:hypothetical protein CCACVL1_04013 [Corchorus capsularis]|uniref:Uncharacterized protein n=1 Tax=Corchorus capsularis TaxID=210143 RepID=A0A1R3JVH1_COCAP|nr:hypothetical protein CCACVL1_04013 [Corchorus capsularis]